MRLRGAVYGLNVVAPGGGDDLRLRPAIGLAPGMEGGAFDLDGYLGLHPALARLLPLWHARKPACVHASGSPDATRSHVEARDDMESLHGIRDAGRLDEPPPGRAARPAAPGRLLGIGPVLPRILSGRAGLPGRPSRPHSTLYAGHPRFGRAYADGRAAHREVMDVLDGRELRAADCGAPLPAWARLARDGRLSFYVSEYI